MKHMKEVKRYQCQFCKQEFKTPNRHSCKRDPAKKNCYTCENNKVWEVDEYSDESGVLKFIYPDCENATENGITAELLYYIKYDLQCESYIQKLIVKQR